MEVTMKDVSDLRQQEADLEQRLAEVRRRLSATAETKHPRRVGDRRPFRELVLDALHEAAAPLNSLLIASVFRPLFDRDVASTRFGTLSADEQRSFDSNRPRPVYLCHCLTQDRGQSMKRFWARSDWPLSERIIGPMSGRVLFLRGAEWAIRLASTAAQDAADADRLRFVAADQARDAGLPVRRGEFPFDEWIANIRSQLDRFVGEDRELRERASEELAQRLDDRALLFGAPAELMSIPGTSKQWNSKSS
jgi:hypothetical protein